MLLLTACGSSSGATGASGSGGGARAVGGASSGGADAPAGSGGRGHDGAAGGSVTSSDTGVPIYEPPTWPALPDGPCRFSLAPTSSLCGGRSNCPVLLDAQFAGDAATKHLEMAATASGAAYLVFAGSHPSTASHCLFSVDGTGNSAVAVNPFAPPPSAAGVSGEAIALAADASDGPHALVGGYDKLLHFSQSGAEWTSEMLPLPSGQTEFRISGVVSSKLGISLLVGSHPPGAGYSRSFTLQLFTGSGAGPWQTTQVFAGADTQELMSSALSVDATGAVVATYRTRLDLSADAVGYAAYLWRDGVTSALSAPSPTWDGAFLQTPGDSTTKDSALRFGDDHGVQLVLPRAGDLPRALVVPGTARVPLDGCFVDFDGGSRPPTCAGHAGKMCTLKGSTLLMMQGPQRTDDGAIWFVYSRQDVDQDVVLRDYNSGGSDALTYCAADVQADRTTWNLYVARAASAEASAVELRLKVPVSSSTMPGAFASDARFQARGNLLFLAYGSQSPYRYLVLDASRL